MTEISEKEILNLIRTKNSKEKGFELLVRKYQKKVYFLIRRIVFRHDIADDLTQDVFLKVWEKMHTFREDSKLFTWIYRIAVNEALGFLKKERRMETEDSCEVAVEVSYNDPLFTGDAIYKKLLEAVAGLPPQQQLIFNMRYFDEMKYDEISEVLNLSTGALKASYHHAVKKIEKLMNPD